MRRFHLRSLPACLRLFLKRRPDVLAAEQNVRAANAEIGVATAAFFPTLGLTTFLGKVSSPLSEITAGSTNAWSVGANLAGPIYQGGALRAKKKQAIASWEQAREQYLQTSLNAFRDVSDALVSREKYDLIRAEQVRAVRAGEESVELSLTRFREGLSSYYEVLEAQQQLFPAQSALAQTELESEAGDCPAIQGAGRRMESDGCRVDGRPGPGRHRASSHS